MKAKTVGIIGGTRGMGKWFAEFLMARGINCLVTGSRGDLSLEELARQAEVVVISVPISVTEEVIARVGPLIRKEGLIMDLTSLKTKPVAWMLAHSASEVIGTHPLFGPNPSAEDKKQFVVCPARGERWLPWLKRVLREGGIGWIETSPEKHDEIMALVQGLNHLSNLLTGVVLSKKVGSLEEIKEYATPLFAAKLRMVEKVLRENPGLYKDILCKNHYFKEVILLYHKTLDVISSLILEDRGEELGALMEKAARILWPSSPDDFNQ